MDSEFLESSIFVKDGTKPLLSMVDREEVQYELLHDDEDIEMMLGSGSWESHTNTDNNDDMFNANRWLNNFFNSSSFTNNDQVSDEILLNDLYSYYLIRGFYRFLSYEIGQFVIWSWLVFFFVFMGTCVNYEGIKNITGTTQESLWSYVSFSNFGSGWFFIISLILYSIYAIWCIIKITRNSKKMWFIKKYYQEVLNIDDFFLRTARWTDVVSRIVMVSMPHLTRKEIASRIVSKENCFKALLQRGLIEFSFTTPFRGELCMLTRGLQWNVMNCIVNFFFDSQLRKKNFGINSVSRIELSQQLQKRITILCVFNVILMPFLIVFVALYAIFRYGEEFYKNPNNITARQWSLEARWYFREFNEMPHVLDERLRVSSKYATRYIEQFPPGPLDGIARSMAFIVGAIVVWLLIVSAINEHALLMLNFSPGKTILWWITLLSAVWVLCRNMLKEQHVFSPTNALEIVQVLVKKLPPNFIPSAGTKEVLGQFRKLFSLRITQLLLEFLGVLITPWILYYRVRHRSDDIVDFLCDYGNIEDEVVVEDFDSKILQSAELVERIKRIDD